MTFFRLQPQGHLHGNLDDYLIDVSRVVGINKKASYGIEMSKKFQRSTKKLSSFFKTLTWFL